MPRRTGWTDKILIFFSDLQKLEQRAKKWIELHGEYVEYIPISVAVACFLPGRAKDLSAPFVMCVLIYCLEPFFLNLPLYKKNSKIYYHKCTRIFTWNTHYSVRL